MNLLPSLQYKNNNNLYKNFLNLVKNKRFQGDICENLADRISVSTDNSIYQVIPNAVIFPKTIEDIKLVFKLANSYEFKDINFTPRGGGTGTNGQSLTEGIIIDCSRYLNKIKKVNVLEKYAIIEPAVVLDELNNNLKENNLFFAPNLSPSDRATIGGMINTDACGKGSKVYGRTSQHILELKCLLVSGKEIKTKHFSKDEFLKIIQKEDEESFIYKKVHQEIEKNKNLINEVFPKMDRFMTGYNLAKVCEDDGINLNYLIGGSEGTLVYVVEIKINLLEIPKQKHLFTIFYNNFNNGLKEAQNLLSFEPSAIETVDNNILGLAKNDEVWANIENLIFKDSKDTILPEGLNLVEFISNSKSEIDIKVSKLKKYLIDKNYRFYDTKKDLEMSYFWDLRKKGVGLLGSMKGNRKPIPFMEDTAVPPENLSSYILELRELLDSYNLKYGMFGHVDVGCLHVRPALDINDKNDRNLIIEITKKVNNLVKKYGGIYWSEHGKGFRSEYVKDYFGEKLYKSLQNIKETFDPLNKLNPGKIAVSNKTNTKLVKVDGPFKGFNDEKVNKKVRNLFSGAFNCNGNASCLNFNVNNTMCPSAKVSRNWNYSPKGRSSLLREWLKQLENKNYNILSSKNKNLTFKKKINKNDFSYEAYKSFEHCLGCKACATSCPIKVDIPHMKSLFLNEYHKKYKRNLRDYFLAYSDKILYLQLKFPKISKFITNSKIIQKFILNRLKLKNIPKLSKKNIQDSLKSRNILKFSFANLKKLSFEEKNKSICLIQDSLNTAYDTEVFLDIYDFLTKLGFYVYILPFRENGKSYHSKGFLKQFTKIAYSNNDFYGKINNLGLDIISIEPSLNLCFRDEYKQLLKSNLKFKVYLIQEWLSKKLNTLSIKRDIKNNNFYLYMHCSEKSLAGISVINWQEIFKFFNQDLKIANVGCCGMAGSYGHEQEIYSKKIYNLSWKKDLENKNIEQNILVTGFSCRSQIDIIEQKKAQHPIQALHKIL